MPDQVEYATLKTVVGPKQIPVPKPLKDETSIVAWSRLLTLRKQLKAGGYIFGASVSKYKTKRDRMMDEAKADILQIILANSNGMSPMYWQHEADKLSVEVWIDG